MTSRRLLTPRGTGWHERGGAGFFIHEDSPGDAHLAFAAAVVRGLEARPRRLEPRFIYDAAGSVIYEAITELPEYYPTRTEDGILASCAPQLVEQVGPTTLVELGSGSSTKTRRLLDAWSTANVPVSYVPIDVSATAVDGACVDLRNRYPNLRVEGVASTFQRGLALVEDVHPKTLLFLGSTLGNFEPDEVDAFFRQVSDVTAPGDFFVLGVDLAKASGVLEPAYDDSKGLTEQFILNVFTRMNRELGSDVDLDAFEMHSFYDRERQRIEMWAHVKQDQVITVSPLGRNFHLAGGERILVEVSRKFTIDQVREEASRYDLMIREVYQDPRQYFAVILLQRREGSLGRVYASAHTPAPRRPEAPPVGAWRKVPGGAALLGEPPTAKNVDAIELGATPVTCGEFRRFVEAGGYEQPSLWSEEGQAWLAACNEKAPLGWEPASEGRWRVHGAPLDYLDPVSGVCFWEAEAYAQWVGARLPTEAEWEKGAAWDPERARQVSWPWGELPPDPMRANAGGGLSGPVAVGSYPRSVSFYGLHQVLGDVWEWVWGEEGPVLRGGSYLTALQELQLRPSPIRKCGAPYAGGWVPTGSEHRMTDAAWTDGVLAIVSLGLGFRLLSRGGGSATVGVGLFLVGVAAAFGTFLFSGVDVLAPAHRGVTLMATLIGMPLVGVGYVTAAFANHQAHDVRRVAFVLLLIAAVFLMYVDFSRVLLGALGMGLVMVGAGVALRTDVASGLAGVAGALGVLLAGLVVGTGDEVWGPLSRTAWFHLSFALSCALLAAGVWRWPTVELLSDSDPA